MDPWLKCVADFGPYGVICAVSSYALVIIGPQMIKVMGLHLSRGGGHARR